MPETQNISDLMICTETTQNMALVILKPNKEKNFIVIKIIAKNFNLHSLNIKNLFTPFLFLIFLEFHFVTIFSLYRCLM